MPCACCVHGMRQGYDAQALEDKEVEDVDRFVKQERKEKDKGKGKGKGKVKDADEEDEQEEQEEILDEKPWKELGMDHNVFVSALHDWV